MLLLGLGLVLLALKALAVAPVAGWSWWAVLAPLAAAVLWWAWADASGYTRRRMADREARRKQDRVERQRELMGQGTRRRR